MAIRNVIPVLQLAAKPFSAESTTGFITAFGCNRLRNLWIYVFGKKASRRASARLRCLFTSGLDRIPVLVWIFGGGFNMDSTSISGYSGKNLAQKGVVLVSIGSQVGQLGFLAHPELTAESPHHASGNYGLLDMIAALQWIQKNIAAFGGDPDKVTIFGESAGGIAVS